MKITVGLTWERAQTTLYSLNSSSERAGDHLTCGYQAIFVFRVSGRGFRLTSVSFATLVVLVIIIVVIVFGVYRTHLDVVRNLDCFLRRILLVNCTGYSPHEHL